MKRDYLYVKNAVENLREYAKLHGQKLVFRNTPTNAGDFCFFIYKPGYSGYHTKYLIGFDGCWDVDPKDNISFDRCLDAVHKFISNYKD